MPDFKAYVRQHLPPLGVSGAREAEIVEELALHFQESYERALRSGLDPEQAWPYIKEYNARCQPPWKDHEILHTAGEHGTSQYPECSGQIAKLRRQNRTNQWARSGDGCEVVAKDYPLVGDEEIATILQSLRGRGSLGVQSEDFGCDETAVETIAEGVTASRCHDEPQGINWFAAAERDHSDRQSAEHDNGAPSEKR